MAKFTIELQDDTVEVLRKLLTGMPQEGPMGPITIEKLAVILLGEAAMVIRRPESSRMLAPRSGMPSVLWDLGYRTD